MEQQVQSPRILLIDIETSPILGWAWDFYDTNLVDIFRDWSILCFAYKWDDERTIHVSSIKKPKDILDFVTHPDNDLYLLKELWRLLDQADVVVAHNGKRFDTKKIHSRMLHYGMTPPSPYKVIDTLAETKRVSNNTRNNQDFLLKHWGLGAKMEHEGWPMWLGYMSGITAKYKQMHAYNKQDVAGLEPMYKRISPWVTSFNAAVFSDAQVCPHPGCGSTNLEKRGHRYNNTTRYNRLYCRDCGGWSRTSKNLKETRTLVSI